MTVNLDLTAYRASSAKGFLGQDVSRSLGFACGDSKVGTVVTSICNAISAASADSNAIDFTSIAAQPDQIARVIIALKGVYVRESSYNPGLILGPFIDSVRSAYPATDTYLAHEGKLNP